MFQFRVYQVLYFDGGFYIRDQVTDLLLFGFFPLFKRRFEVSRRPAVPSDATRLSVLFLDDHQCVYCGRRKGLACDHVIPASRGGPSTVENLVAACIQCNSIKGNRTPEEARMPMVYGRFARYVGG